METRANFILIGLFTLLGILGGLAGFIWLTSVQIDRQYTQYGVLFDNVAGLDQSADVLFNGVNVGRVVSIRIWENDPSLVYVGIETDATTPVAVDTIAQLESSGVTGVAYIALAGGSPDAASLPLSEDGPPIIPSRRSSFQSLVSSAPDLVDDAVEVLDQIEEITGPQNQEYIQSILQNVDTATANLDAALGDFAEMSQNVQEVTRQITNFTERLDGISAAAETTLQQTDETLAAVTQTFETANTTLKDMSPAIANAEVAFGALEQLASEELAPLSDSLEQTLASANQAFLQADEILSTDLGPVISDARETMSALSVAATALTSEFPAIITDLRGIVGDARTGVAAATPVLREFGQLGGEARALVRTLNDLVRQISRDPARILLDDRVPDYRR